MENKTMIEIFINQVKESYNGTINIGYELDPVLEEYKIWHDIKDYNSEEFREFIGNLLRNNLFENDIFNFYISYDEEKAKLNSWNLVNIGQEKISLSESILSLWVSHIKTQTNFSRYNANMSYEKDKKLFGEILSTRISDDNLQILTEITSQEKSVQARAA